MESTCTPAHQTVKDEDADALAPMLAQGLDPNEVCHGMTLLAHAVEAESGGPLQRDSPMTVDLITLLLEPDADPDLAGPDGQTPLGIALADGHDRAAALLRQHIAGR
ncbi:ankyrin repeat domain-containing protein [Streptomyces sp. NPDC060235]|uniref:ankyrin repeat domain-containing protein n=1 Tax=Streptomyces sp. NPDC060235 TaxID=3347080 RepID=UPI00365872E5